MVICGESSSTAEDSINFDKRGGARPFYGFYDSPGNKRISALGVSPYYLYDKRGGGRDFALLWNRSGYGSRVERRGGGRAFAGSWKPDYISRYYEMPYYNKRSSNLWEFLQTPNEF
ncbi:unnamed protein product [Auanema sp. JU1783]|nr:unnamed protein product [Auanema sp. JU1783]